MIYALFIFIILSFVQSIDLYLILFDITNNFIDKFHDILPKTKN